MLSKAHDIATPPQAEYPRFRGLKPLKIGPYPAQAPIILAPMAGVSEAPYREFSLEFGAGWAPTELVSAKGLQYQNARTEAYLRHDPEKEPLLWVQVFGGEPTSMAQAAELAVQRGARIVDINMGCPVKKVTRNGAGSALMTDPERAAAVVAAMVEQVGPDIPVTGKIRAGWDENSKNAASLGKALEDAGLAAIAIHPRTRRQGYSGCANWDIIAELKEAVSIPVIANGDIFSVQDAEKVVEHTNCDAVMIGRAALGNPWIFRELSAAYLGNEIPTRPSPQERTEMIVRHLEAHINHHQDEVRAVRKFRQHLIWYSRGMRGGSRFRDVAMQTEEKETLFQLIEDFFSRAELTDLTEAPIYDERTAFG